MIALRKLTRGQYVAGPVHNPIHVTKVGGGWQVHEGKLWKPLGHLPKLDVADAYVAALLTLRQKKMAKGKKKA